MLNINLVVKYTTLLAQFSTLTNSLGKKTFANPLKNEVGDKTTIKFFQSSSHKLSNISSIDLVMRERPKIDLKGISWVGNQIP